MKVLKHFNGEILKFSRANEKPGIEFQKPTAAQNTINVNNFLALKLHKSLAENLYTLVEVKIS